MAAGPGQPPPEVTKVKELILDALRESVKRYPDVKQHLRGDARWIAEVYTYKVGEAPDDDQRRKDERLLERLLSDFFTGQLERIIKRVRKEFKAFEPSFWDDEFSMLWEELGADFVGIMMHGVYGGLGQLPGVQIDMDKMSIDLIRLGRQYRDKWLSLIEETSRKYVEEHILTWQLSGDPLSALIKALQDDSGGMFTKARAKRIAVTEVTRLHAFGNQAAWEEAGDVKQWKWMTAQDELVCKICRAGNAGGPYPLSQLSDLLPAHVNCRCWAQPIVDISNLEEEIRQMLGGEGGEQVPIGKLGTYEEVMARFQDVVQFRNGMPDLSTLDLDTVKEIAEKYEKIINKYPQLKGKFSEISSNRIKGAYFAKGSLTEGKIVLNNRCYNKTNREFIIEQYNNQVYGYDNRRDVYDMQGNLIGQTGRKYEGGFHPVGTNHTSIITHEIGHNIDGFLTGSGYGGMNNGRIITASVNMQKEVLKSLGMAEDEILRGVSEYATKNKKEFFAECFAEYMDSPSPRPIAAAFGKILEEWMKGLK